VAAYNCTTEKRLKTKYRRQKRKENREEEEEEEEWSVCVMVNLITLENK